MGRVGMHAGGLGSASKGRWRMRGRPTCKPAPPSTGPAPAVPLANLQQRALRLLVLQLPLQLLPAGVCIRKLHRRRVDSRAAGAALRLQRVVLCICFC